MAASVDHVTATLTRAERDWRDAFTDTRHAWRAAYLREPFVCLPFITRLNS